MKTKKDNPHQVDAVVIPKNDIDRLEQARIDLCSFFDTETLIKLHSITQSMWHITHRKYKKYNAELSRRPEGASVLSDWFPPRFAGSHSRLSSAFPPREARGERGG